MKRISFLILAAVLISAAAWADNGVKFAFDVYQYDSTRQENVRIVTDTARLVRGIAANGFLAAFSVEVKIDQIDSAQVSFDLHLVTLGPPAEAISRRFSVEYGLPAAIKPIAGKGAAIYKLVVTPLSAITVDTSGCAFSHRDEGVFRFDPTANMDLYFVPNSLGDYYFGSVKELFEHDYRLFKNLLDFNLPGKYHVFLCPCPLSSVIWDNRFGMAIDPTSGTAFAIYSQSINSADPFLIVQMALLRNLGYAPPFLSEGLASYLAPAVLDMKELQQEGRTLPLTFLLNSDQYYRADPVIADLSSATFVKYLIDQYSLTRLRSLWKVADDLNLGTAIEQIYDRSLSQLEREWHTYIDTVTISAKEFTFHIERSEQMRDYSRMLRYARTFVRQATTADDSLGALYQLKRACFFTGDYYAATTAQAALTNLAAETAGNWTGLGAYKMMNGYYEEARADLLKALEIDSTDNFTRFNLALNNLLTGRETEGRRILQDLVDNPTRYSGGESKVLLAGILRASADKADRALATTYFNETQTFYDQQLQTHRASSTAYLWLGIAFLGLDDTGMAGDYLQTALFLETRPFYQGMTNLWLGKTADLLGDRSAARDFYGRVLSLASADYHQVEARRYLDTPYRQ